MTTEQMFFYGCATITGILAAGVFFTLLRISNKTWGRIGSGVQTAGMMVFFSAAFIAVVIPIYVLTRISDGLQAFMDACLPEVSGLVYRVRCTARAQAEHRLAAWNKSVNYDRDDHARKMAEFDDTDEADANDDAEEAYESVGARY